MAGPFRLFVIVFTILNARQGKMVLKKRLTSHIFVNIITAIMARPKKAPKDRKTASMRIPMTSEEQRAIEQAAEASGSKPVTFVREAALRAAKRLK
ncbi:MAG TPA: hypothetical protein VGM05_05995 [Planctomycetaceae bacterium]|jgi:ACT domain-containing protein